MEKEGRKSVKEEEETTVNSGTAGVRGKAGHLINLATLGPPAPNTQPSEKNKNQSSTAKIGRKAHNHLWRHCCSSLFSVNREE